MDSKSEDINKLLAKYKEHIAETRLEDEVYKWEDVREMFRFLNDAKCPLSLILIIFLS